jgi:large subunit ribosomal protein L30
MAANKMRITLVKSPIGCKPEHRRTVQALGLRKLGSMVEKTASPAILGMINSVSYLLDVEEIRS